MDNTDEDKRRKKEHNRKYREAHREEVLAYHRRYYRDHKSYFQRKRRERAESKPEEINTYHRRLRRKQRRAVLDLLGGKCVICNRKDSETKLIVHQRYGKPHGTSYVKMLTHMEDFVVLCLPHHSMVHRLKNTERLEAMIGVCQDLLGGQ